MFSWFERSIVFPKAFCRRRSTAIFIDHKLVMSNKVIDNLHTQALQKFG